MKLLSCICRQVEDDLETMWQVATADNRRMQETMRKTVRKLKEHASLNAVIEDMEEDEKEIVVAEMSKDM